MSRDQQLASAATGAARTGAGESCDDPRLARAVDEYRALLRAGQRPDRWEFLSRYPEVAGELADCLSGLDFLHGAAQELSQPVVLSAASPAAPDDHPQAGGCLGDFRIIGEVGRGGMGVVYEAEQLSLGRRVALKVLPFAATMDPRQLQRFHNEARAAAGLHHTNIVPVYAVGCERGVHFYAMQFIDGRSLAEFIAQQTGTASSPMPTVSEAESQAAAASAPTVPPAAQATSAAPREAAYFRRVAEWGIQAAEALDCAHQMGVVHRDVKPANLLVDRSGRLWVTDFGLAQVQSNSRLTMTGDLVGTLRYMSPEQALGKRVVIDHRTDVYSLGATLYELLTLRPAYDGNDRQELLRQIAFEEPSHLRRLNRAIPAELETIVLKAMEKNPADRYATAQELADDLRRFLDDRPIRARRPTLAQRAAKWARRHQGAVLIAAALAGLAALALGGSTAWVAWASRQKGDALAAKTQALGEKEQALQEAREKGEQLRIKSDEAQKNLEEAQKNLAGATTNLMIVDNSVQEFRNNGDQLWRAGRLREAAEAYRVVLKILDKINVSFPLLGADAMGQVSTRKLFRAGTLTQLAAILAELGEATPEMENCYRQAIPLWAESAAESPPLIPYYRWWEAAAHSGLGDLLADMDRPKEAETSYRTALDLLGQLPEKGTIPLPFQRLETSAQAHAGLGALLWSAGKNEKVSVEFRQAVADWEAAQASVKGINWALRDELAAFLADCPDPKCRNPRRAVELAQEAVNMAPKQGRCWRTLAIVQYRAGDPAATLNALDEADIRLPELGSAGWFYKAMAHWKRGQKDEARRCFKQAETERGKNPSARLTRLRDEAAALLEQKKD
jgi:serine/threonine protein kinase